MKDKIIGQFQAVRDTRYREPAWNLKHVPTGLFTGVTHRSRRQAWDCATAIQEAGIRFDTLEEMEPVRAQLVAVLSAHRPI